MSKIIVVYGGGFQPFHAGHLSSYLEAKEAFPNADFYVAASNDTKTRPIPFDDKKFLAQQAGVSDPFVQVKAPINPKEILDRYSPKQDIFILIRSERDPMGYTKKDGSPGYFQPFTDISKCEPFGYHGYVFVTHKKEFKLNGEVVYSGTQVRDMYANSDDKGRLSMIKQLYPQSKQQKAIKQMLDQYIGSSEPIVEPDTSAIKQLKAKKLKEQIQRMRPLLKEGTIEQKYKFLKLMKEAAQLNELNLFKKKADTLAQKPVANDDYRAYFNKQEPAKIKALGKVYNHPDEYYAATKKDPLNAKQAVQEFALPDDGSENNERWYTDSEIADIIGDVWFEEFDVSNDKFNIDVYGEKAKQALAGYADQWFNDNGYNVDVRGVEPNDVDHDLRWYIVGSLNNYKDLNEFAIDDHDGGEEDTLHKYARMWWAGDEATQLQVEKILSRIGWEIGEDEGSYDNGGVFVVRAGDINGDSYTSWPAEDLELDEGQTSDMRNFFSTQQPLNPAPILPSTTGPTVATVTRQGESINELKDETIHSYLSKADRQISNRLDRMSQARERLNKNYEIYDVNNPTKIIDRFEANNPELAREYYNKFIKEYNPGDQDFHFELRRSTGLSENIIIHAGTKVNLILVYKQKPFKLNKEPVEYTDENLKKYAVVAYMYLRETTGKKFSLESIQKAIVVKPLTVNQTNTESIDYLEEK
jgi:hypothetical protein